MNSNKKAFTLVELIVVITILAILATVWFVSFSWYLAWARDTNRIAQLKSMSDALELYRTKKDLPIPDDKVDVQASGSTIAYQGYIGANVLETIEYTEKGLDPKDKNYFSYYLTKNKKYYQLLSFLEEENEDVLAGIFNETKAVDYEERVPHVKWKKLWILTDESNTPIQEVNSVISSWYLDISDLWATVYKTIVSDWEVVSWSWTSLSSTHSNWSCRRIKQLKWWSADWFYTIDPESNWVWFEVYCDMTSEWWWWTRVFYSNSDSVARADIVGQDWNPWDEINFSRLWSMRGIKNKQWLSEFFIKDSSDIWRYFTFTQTNAYDENPVNNSFLQKSGNLYYSTKTDWSTWYWLALWNYWNTQMQTNCTLSNAFQWSTWHYCLQDQNVGGYWTWPWFNDTAYDSWSWDWVMIYQR